MSWEFHPPITVIVQVPVELPHVEVPDHGEPVDAGPVRSHDLVVGLIAEHGPGLEYGGGLIRP